MLQSINKAIEVLKEGGIILYPTDTVWGIGCDATNENAVQKINKLKKRDALKSYIILLDNDIKLNKYVKEIPEIAWDLIEFSTKPITFIYPEGYNLAQSVLAQDKSIAVRIVKDGICHELLKKYGKPIVSTSANLSNKVTPGELFQIDETILNGVDYILKENNSTKNKHTPSTIIRLQANGEITFVRK